MWWKRKPWIMVYRLARPCFLMFTPICSPQLQNLKSSRRALGGSFKRKDWIRHLERILRHLLCYICLDQRKLPYSENFSGNRFRRICLRGTLSILMNILIIKKILIILFSVLSIGAVQANETIIKIGLPLVSPPWNTSQFLQQSIHSLSWKLPQYKFEA